MTAEENRALTSSMSMLDQYKKGTGVFRLRPIQWTKWSTFALNPYTAGLLAHYSVKVSNITQIIAGGAANLKTKFSPPAKLHDLFVEAYSIVDNSGKWLAYSSVDYCFYEYSLNNLTLAPTKVYDYSLPAWENWLRTNESRFEGIHKGLTALGVQDTVVVKVTFDDLANMDKDEWLSLVRDFADKSIAGLIE